MDHRAYKPSTLVGPPAVRLVLDPLAVIFLDNGLFMICSFEEKSVGIEAMINFWRYGENFILVLLFRHSQPVRHEGKQCGFGR